MGKEAVLLLHSGLPQYNGQEDALPLLHAAVNMGIADLRQNGQLEISETAMVSLMGHLWQLMLLLLNKQLLPMGIQEDSPYWVPL